MVTYELREKDGGTEFDLIITDAIEGSKLHKEMLSAQSFFFPTSGPWRKPESPHSRAA